MRRVVAALAVTALLVGGCSGWGADDSSRGSHSLTTAELESDARVHLPPGTAMLSTSFESSQDWHLTAAFRIPGTALPEFLRTGQFGEPVAGLRVVTNMDHPDSDTWRPDAVANVSGVDQTAVGDHVEGVYRKLLLDQSRTGEVTVYLVAFTT